MDILDLKPLGWDIIDFWHNENKVDRDAIKYSIGADIKEQEDRIHFIITVTVDVTLNTTSYEARIITQSKFIVKLKDKVIKLTSDRNFWQIADLAQESLSNSRVLLSQQLETSRLKPMYIPLSPIGSIYQLIQDGSLSLWN